MKRRIRHDVYSLKDALTLPTDADRVSLYRIDEKVLDVLSVNKTVTDFEFFQVNGSDFGTIQFEYLFHINHLYLLACKSLEDVHLTGLSKMAGLKSLGLVDCIALTEGCAHLLSGLRHLESLSLFSSHNIGKSGIRALIDAFPNLKWVDLGQTQVDDDGVQKLLSLSVESIAIRCTRITDQAFHKAELCGTLTDIDAAQCLISDTTVMFLAKCRKLEAVNFAFCKILSTGCVDHLLQMRELKRLDLSGCRRIDGNSLGRLSNLENLTNLTLLRTLVTDEAVRAISCLKNLEYLDLFGCKGITPRALEIAIEFKNLKKVRISDSGITQALSITAVREKFPGIEWV